MNIITDSHVHTSFSTDSHAEPEAVIQSAISIGLKYITITDHQDFGYPGDDFKLSKNVDNYFRQLRDLREKYMSQIDIGIGCEIGLEADKLSIINNFIKSEPFDYIIGSSHLVDGIDIYYPDFYQGKTTSEAINRYLDSVSENINTYSDYDIYGHIDYIIRYAPKENQTLSLYDYYGEKIDNILSLLIEKGKGIEINTGGYKSGLSEPNPSYKIIKRYHELGGKIITFGSDAHSQEYLGYRFDDAALLAREAGFKSYFVYRNRAIYTEIAL